MVPKPTAHTCSRAQKHLSRLNSLIHQRLEIIVFNVSVSFERRCSVIGIDGFCMSAALCRLHVERPGLITSQHINLPERNVRVTLFKWSRFLLPVYTLGARTNIDLSEAVNGFVREQRFYRGEKY